MGRSLLLACLCVAACQKTIDTTEPDAAVVVNPDNISGTIAQSVTWTGTVHVVGPTTVAAAATVTVEAGTTIIASPTAVINVAGRFVVDGTSAAKVVLQPAMSRWGGFEVTGALTMHYAEQTNGGIELTDGTATILDTLLIHQNDSRDFLIMNGGSLDMEYSKIGPPAGLSDVIHCNFHFNPDVVNTIKVVHTDISNAMYGADYLGGTADLTYDNWFTNTNDVFTEAGSSVTADLSHGWFQAGAPVPAPGSAFTTDSLSPTRLTDTGPRP